MRSVWRHRAAYLFIAPAIVHFLAFQLYPILWSVSLSFVRFNMQGNRWVGGQNYALLVGDPQSVIDKILWEHELFAHQRFLLQMSVGTMPHEKIMHSIELLGSVVAPAVKRALSGER